MKNKYLKLIFLLLTSFLWMEASAFTLIVKSTVKLKHLKIGEHYSTDPFDLVVGINQIELDKYPNAAYLLQMKSPSNFKYLSMIWVPSDTSSIEITVDADYGVTFSNESEYQTELNKIFDTSNKMNLFPYEPEDSKPLEPILALEAKAMIQDGKTRTERAVLENLLELSKKRKINNWTTDAISSYLNEPPEGIYVSGNLKKIFGFDGNENLTEIKPDKENYILIAASGSWCGPCVKGIPDLRKSYDKLNESVLFVSLWNDPDIRTFRDNHREKKSLIAWPSLWDRYGLMTNALQVQFYPTYILFDSKGNEIKRWEGKSPGNLESIISK
ncbi:MAG: TlpA family protein disulfide reductase [Cyclobacteriaceae bacterium]|nr:TlpA family protein disulfide reductase [Cyclobacteriaceae bacterium]